MATIVEQEARASARLPEAEIRPRSAAAALRHALMVPGMLLSVIGSTVLGIALLRADYTPRLTAWLLALTFPLTFVGSDVLGITASA